MKIRAVLCLVSAGMYGVQENNGVELSSQPIYRHLIANNVNASGNITLQGAEIQNITVVGTLEGRHTTFGVIHLTGEMLLIDSSADVLHVHNEVIHPSDRPVVLDGSSVTGDITFTGAFGRAIIRNGALIGGSVINGEIIEE